jgi:hypothetical protein
MYLLAYFDLKVTIVLIAVCAIPVWATAQNDPKNSAKAATPPLTTCPTPAQVHSRDLYGSWTLEIPAEGSAQPALRGRLELAQNPEFADSISGWLHLEGRKIFVAGDIEDASLSLEESEDGQRISAVWDGDIDPHSCGNTITGTRRVGEQSRPFVLRKGNG